MFTCWGSGNGMPGTCGIVTSAEGISDAGPVAGAVAAGGVAAGMDGVAAGAVGKPGISDPSGALAAAGVTAVGDCGSVTDAVADGTGAGAAAGVPLNAELTPCSSCGAAAGTPASWLTIGRPGAPGTAGAGATGSACAAALSANATGTAPAAAIMLVESAFQVKIMVLPIGCLERLSPKLSSYWCDSRDTCGGYSTVTAPVEFVIAQWLGRDAMAAFRVGPLQRHASGSRVRGRCCHARLALPALPALPTVTPARRPTPSVTLA
ncbi:hypothetical protein FR943_20990 [Mycobacterium sp. TNTM28]|uniref:Uncharacterized protein n=1 Tax=[Mycobacterium] fortunisiensis TaxID=2600579 RepID=A0ABS6KRX1_9MYCO|nr:hypothetical protein [[Mycobacterium] fortunisiensis]